jgi:serine protease Do
VDVVIWRDNARKTVRVRVGELEAGEAQLAALTQNGAGTEQRVDDLGMTLSVITDALRQRFSLAEDVEGLVVVGVDDAGPASEKGIQPGDVVVEVSQEDAVKPSQVADLVNKAKKAGRKSVLLLVEGQGRLRFEAVRIDG